MGNTFIINCKVGITHEEVKSIDQTVDYQQILLIIKQKMAVPTPLLETLVGQIENEVKLHFPALRYFFISIQKKNPPLGVQADSSEISLEKKY